LIVGTKARNFKMLIIPEFLTVNDELQNMSFDEAAENVLNFLTDAHIANGQEGDLLAAMERCRSLYNELDDEYDIECFCEDHLTEIVSYNKIFSSMSPLFAGCS